MVDYPTLASQKEESEARLAMLVELIPPQDLPGISIGQVFDWGLSEELITKFEYLIAKRHLPWHACRD